MAKCTFVVALALALVGSAASPKALEPPVISEGFTLLPCTAKKTTIGLEGCAEHRIVRSDRGINRRARTIFFLLRRFNSPAAQLRFVRGEHAWLRYRRAVCASRSDVYEGGSAAGVVFAECEAAKNTAHLRELESFERLIRRR